MILGQETFERYRYYPDDLKPQSHKPILAVCDDCGKVRVTSKKDYRSLCRSCARKGERSHLFGKTDEKAPSWKGGLVKRVCEACGKEFEVYPSEIRKGGGKFCSISCATKGENNPTWNGGVVKRICEACGKEFEVYPSRIKIRRGRFCSLSCATKGENANNWKGGLVKRVCETCGKGFEVSPSVIKKGWGRFCSKSCARKKKIIPTHHTKPERKFEEICKKYDINFKYVGDGSLWIGKERALNPDFIQADGQKVIVEIFGDYWHSPLINRNLKEHSTLTYRKKYYKKYGWKTIFLWETDLMDRKDAELFVLSQLKKEGII